jgi:cytochrome bd-type quinol oxidase subunit 2
MITKLKKLMLATFALGLLAVPALAVSSSVGAQAGANIDGSLCQGADLKFGGDESCNQGNQNPEDKVNSLITEIVNIFSVIVGVVAVVMIIIGGFRYITSGGDSGNVTGAKNTILYAVIGLVIVALAQFIVKFVLKSAIEAGN